VKSKLLALAAGGSALALSLAVLASNKAHADLVTVTYGGTINNGFDTTGVFGTANSSLNGDSIGFVFTFDTSLGALSSGATFSQLSGGGGSVVVTINGHSVTIVDVLPSAPNVGNMLQLLRNQDNGFGNRFTQDNVANDFLLHREVVWVVFSQFPSAACC
jgi:hypothetical protein